MVEAERSKLLSMIVKKLPLPARKNAAERKENKHNEVDGRTGIAGFPAEPACLLYRNIQSAEEATKNDMRYRRFVVQARVV
jgi:hypothetical protein